jgi:UDP-N-acetylmuramyl pentapeptide synthase
METALFHRLLEAEFYGNFPEKINGFWNDTRTLRPGDCFLALAARRDGHEFLLDAERNGASCAIVNCIDRSLTLPQLCVNNVFESAKTLAKIHREGYTIVAVTGSYGKTSTKDMLKLLLGASAHATEENLNNELGITLTLSRIQSEKFGIIEGGIDHPGEMDRVIDLIEPDISITVGVTFTHVANFTKFEQLIGEKFKILENTLSRKKIGIVAENCLQYAPFRQLSDQFIVTGHHRNTERYPNFTRFQWLEERKIILSGKYFDGTIFSLPEMSGGQVENFVKAATAAKILGLGDQVIGERILQWKPGKLRGETIKFRGREVYLDCYNANPISMLDALQFFDQKYPGDNTYILGGMGELGEFSDASHKIVAAYFYGKKEIIIFAIGKEMWPLYDRLRSKGSNVLYCDNTQQAKEYFPRVTRGNIFIKGSWRHRLWELIEEKEGVEKK